MEQRIGDFLYSLGIRRTTLGYLYLKHVLLLCLQDEDYMLCYARLFGKVGALCHTTTDNVDHCIRAAAKKCWITGNREFLIEIAGYQLTSRPTNSEFIEILYHHLEKVLNN